MKVFEYAKENGKESAEILKLLGNSERSHMSNLTEDEIILLDNGGAKTIPDHTQKVEDETDTEELVAQLTSDLSDTQALLKIQEDLNHEMKDRIVELEEELKLLGTSPEKPAVQKGNAGEITAKLKKGKSEAELGKITHDMRCKGVKSEYWDKYQILLSNS